jgi:hypothetical protein
VGVEHCLSGPCFSCSYRFQALKERYDRVTAVCTSSCRGHIFSDSPWSSTKTNEGHKRDLNVASAKLKELQAENECVAARSCAHCANTVRSPSFLLDAINVAEPDLTMILSPLQHEGVNPHITPPEAQRIDTDNNVAIASRTPHLQSQSPHMNGSSSARHPNGNRHRPIKVRTSSVHLCLNCSSDLLDIA